MRDIKVGFVGMGRVGGAVAAHLDKRGISVSGFFDIDPKAKGRGFKKFNNTKELAAAADIIFLTVPDGKIAAAAKELKKHSLGNKIVCHASGMLDADILGHKNACAAHPLCAVPHDKTRLDGITFSLEGPKASVMAKVFKMAGNPVVKISAGDKHHYHAACVIAGNLNFALLHTAAEMFKKIKVPKNSWKKLFLQSAEHFFEGGLKALTGPLARGDAKTIKAHLKILRGQSKNIYKTLSAALETELKK